MLSITLSTLMVLTTWIAAGFFALSAARTARTPQGAMGWVVFLLSLPVIALPAYMFFGHHRFKSYRDARRQSARTVQGIKDFSHNYAVNPEALQVNPAPFEAVAGLPVCCGNGFELLINGKDAFSRIFNAIDAAEDYVLVQFYIVRDDGLGRRLRDHMLAATERGVAVWFITDSVGSHSLPHSYSARLQEAGINLVDPRTRRGPKHRFLLNFRNHRKTVIIDGKVGFTGGLNVGDEYLGKDPSFGAWRDTNVRITGPAVLQLQLSFAEDWHWLTEEHLLDLLDWTAQLSKQNFAALIIATGPGDSTTETGSMMFFSAISAAKERIWITSPYFVPDLDVLSALKHAALKGLDVRILLPDNIDHYAPWLAAYSYFDDLRAAGVRIFRYNQGFMHQKVVLIDESIAGIGTTNLDNRSFRLNFETMAFFFDRNAAQQVSRMLETDFTHAFEIIEGLDQQKLLIRLAAPVARLFAPVL
ncbi:cardiolipin synthase [Sedimentitalea sp. CY04]|uniref:Cardiolipin synthase n=1 Tax=Parasedimentitalea denitrificans TaxID=2211118 RepID=A0ABX0WF99_9RHOB|nr:cardiolipin synthase [Sedimentitalea sp. CY04]NIZ63357.1 cardiolipin synthase [Sedimentitalea sp. CY04]